MREDILIPDESFERAVEAVCQRGWYEVPDGMLANPIAKFWTDGWQEFAKSTRQLRRHNTVGLEPVFLLMPCSFVGLDPSPSLEPPLFRVAPCIPISTCRNIAYFSRLFFMLAINFKRRVLNR